MFSAFLVRLPEISRYFPGILLSARHGLRQQRGAQRSVACIAFADQTRYYSDNIYEYKN